MTYMVMPQDKNPWPGGHEIYNVGHHYYALSLSESCQSLEKRIFKEIMLFHYMPYMAMPQDKNPCSGGHEIYNFDRLLLVHHYFTLILSDL